MLVDVFITTFVVALGLLVTVPRLRDLGPSEAKVALGSYGLHVFASVATIVVSNVLYAGVVDFAGFHRAGQMISDELRTDFWEVAPRMVRLFFHQEAIINVPLNLEPKGGKSTVSMWILAAAGDVIFFRSFQATAAACAVWSFAGKLALWKTLRTHVPVRLRTSGAMAMLLVPSVVYWTSGLIKEGIAFGGLGFALSGAVALLRRQPRGLAPFAFGVLVVAMIKPYLLMPLAAGTAAWLYSDRARGSDGMVRIHAGWLLFAVTAAVAGVLGVTRAFPEFSVDTLGEQAARMQYYGQKAAGGSYYLLGNPEETSIAGQLQFAPIAVFTALFRPLLFEANNGQALVNAVETTALLALTAWLFARKGWGWIATNVLSNPTLAFSIAFILPLALGVGLISNNLGTLSRYRCPLVPFFVLLLVTLVRARGAELLVRRRRIAPAPVRAGPERGSTPRLPAFSYEITG